jgi:hypothetical protein
MSDDLWSVELGRGIGVIELGATREEIARNLAEKNIVLDADDEDDWLWVEELDAELRFKTTQPPVLREILVEDDRLRFASLGVIGKRLHEIVDLLRVSDTETLWRLERDDDAESEQGALHPDYPVTDNMLLDHGTLWIPNLGLGLAMVRGEITTVRLRKPEESPKRGLGPLTPAQRELSARKDLSLYLLRPGGPISPRRRAVQKALGIALAVSLALLVWQAINYQRQWDHAPVVEGQVIAVQPPGATFPDEFTILYRDLTGREHQVVFKPADVYVLRVVGEKVEVRYLPEAPDQPLGPARVRDAAFLKYMPWGIGMVAAYLVLQASISAVSWLTQRTKGSSH